MPQNIMRAPGGAARFNVTSHTLVLRTWLAKPCVWLHQTRGGHSHMPCSHNCDRGQSAVNGQNGVFATGQRSKYPETVTFNGEN